jgi:hypothetical protein
VVRLAEIRFLPVIQTRLKAGKSDYVVKAGKSDYVVKAGKSDYIVKAGKSD